MLPRTLTTSDRASELTLSGECVVGIIPFVGAKMGPVYDRLALGQVAAGRYDRNQIATVRVGFEHRFEVLIKYRGIHTVSDVSTIADVDRRLARAERQFLEEAANLVGTGVNYLVSFPAGGAVASRLKVQNRIGLAA